MRTLLIASFLLAGCPEPSPVNPPQLWLAPAQDETQLVLSIGEPEPFSAPGVGAGGSQQAAYAMVDNSPAGVYHLVLDAIILAPVDMTFDLIWHTSTTERVLVEWTAHYDPLPDNYDAQAFEYDEHAPAIDVQDYSERFVFRYSAANTTAADAYIPNGDGAFSNGRIPSILLPR